jgi:DNA-binding HxlR family transcriptional regulator
MSIPTSARLQIECPRVQGLLGLVGDKWTLHIVMVLRERNRPSRFNDLKRSVVGISQQMLTRALKTLERDGMISRTVYSTVPPQVEYELTALGTAFFTALYELGQWAYAHLDEIENNRVCYDAGAAKPRSKTV